MANHGFFEQGPHGFHLESPHSVRGRGIDGWVIGRVWQSNVFNTGTAEEPLFNRHTYFEHALNGVPNQFLNFYRRHRRFDHGPTANPRYHHSLAYLNVFDIPSALSVDQANGASFTLFPTYQDFLATSPWSPFDRRMYPQHVNDRYRVVRVFSAYATKHASMLDDGLGINFNLLGTLSQDRITTTTSSDPSGFGPSGPNMDVRSTIWESNPDSEELQYNVYRNFSRIGAVAPLGTFVEPTETQINLVGGGTISTSNLMTQAVVAGSPTTMARVAALGDFVSSSLYENLIDTFEVDQKAAHTGLFVEIGTDPGSGFGYYWGKRTREIGNVYDLYVPNTVSPDSLIFWVDVPDA